MFVAILAGMGGTSSLGKKLGPMLLHATEAAQLRAALAAAARGAPAAHHAADKGHEGPASQTTHDYARGCADYARATV